MLKKFTILVYLNPYLKIIDYWIEKINKQINK
jgi:hypothetical protein